MRRRLRPALLLSAVLALTAGGGAPAAAAEPEDIGAVQSPFKDGAGGRHSVIDVADLPRVAPPSEPAIPPWIDAPTEAPAVDVGAFAPSEFTPTTAPPAAQPGWNGLQYDIDGPIYMGSPATPWVAVGPDHVVHTVDSAMVIYDRTGAIEQPLMRLSMLDLFDISINSSSYDPRVVFDSTRGRWVVTMMAFTCDRNGNDVANDAGSYLGLMVSRSADPTGAWNLYAFEYVGYLIRDAAPGTSTATLGVAGNVYELGDGDVCYVDAPYAGVDLTIMDWSDLLSSGTGDGVISAQSITYADNGDTTTFRNPRIAQQIPATNGTLHVVLQYDGGSGPGWWYSAITGTVAGDDLTFDRDVDLTGLGVVDGAVDPPAIEQPGPYVLTDDVDSRPNVAVWQNGRLTWVSTTGCEPDGDTTVHACVRVTQIRTTPTLPADMVGQDFVIAEPDADHSFGGIGQSLDGTLHVVWTRTSESPGGEPTAMTAYQRSADPDEYLSEPEVLRQGLVGELLDGRWGISVGVATDPQAPNAVWQGNTFATGDTVDWTTHIAQLQTGGATYVPITPTRVMDSRTATGVAGIYTSSTPRTFDVAGVGVIPDDAIAVTGNLTVTGQTSAGYVSLTSTATATPRSSTLNVPTGDTRANNVTATLASNGRLAAVWKGSSGSRAHLLLDITGYFVAGDDDAAYTPLTPIRVLDSRAGIGTGLAGRFTSGVPRALTVAGTNGIPADALAITANLTVVGQSSGGYVSVTTTSNPAPATSNLNFPVGDVRANGLTAKLQGGALWLVYKGSSGARTDLLLDVTGYYLPDGDGLAFYPLEAGRIMDTRTSLLSGLTGMFKSGTPRRLDVDGHWGVPSGAEAITGNLTVVGQTGGGYVSMTTTSTATPTTSTINVPAADTRANGITSPLNSSGNAFLVFKSSSGKATHLILDVTGYFR